MKKLVAPFILALSLTGCTGQTLPGQTYLAPSSAAPAPTTQAPAPQPAPLSPSAAPAAPPDNRDCMQVEASVIRLCTAYVVTASWTRFQYYQLGHSSNAFIAEYTLNELKNRYENPALQQIINHVASATTTLDTVLYHIDVDQVTLAADSEHATLKTRETWRVANKEHVDVFREDNAPHTVILRKVPSKITEKWIVSEIR